MIRHGKCVHFVKQANLFTWIFETLINLNSIKSLHLEKSDFAEILLAASHALHTDRINLSPFTKDFRVWGAFNE